MWLWLLDIHLPTQYNLEMLNATLVEVCWMVGEEHGLHHLCPTLTATPHTTTLHVVIEQPNYMETSLHRSMKAATKLVGRKTVSGNLG